jgi:hypothetical protein
MADYVARQDPFDLNKVRDHQDYARVPAQLIEGSRREQWTAGPPACTAA